MKKILLALCVLTFLMACSDNDDNSFVNEKKARRTVMVYIAAENNLDYFLDNDLNEMKTGSLQLGEDQNLVIYVNRADSTTTPYMARIFNGELVDSVSMPDVIAADPLVMQNILREIRQRYPAQSYGLVLWGHCTGWLISNQDTIPETRAYGGSTGDNSNKAIQKYWMDIPQMSAAINSAMDGDQLTFIFGDCCCFVSIEVAYELRRVTDYVIGSPAEIPDRGAPYQISVSDFFNESTDFYRPLIDHYYDYWKEEYQKEENKYIYFNRLGGDLAGYSVPLVAINTCELDQVAAATSHLLSTIADKVNATDSLNLEGTMFYAYEKPYCFSYDIQSVFKKNAATEDYITWKKSFDQAISYSRYSSNWLVDNYYFSKEMPSLANIPEEDCNCVGMFFPDNIFKNIKINLNKAIQQFQWNDVIHWEQYGW